MAVNFVVTRVALRQRSAVLALASAINQYPTGFAADETRGDQHPSDTDTRLKRAGWRLRECLLI